MRAIVLLSLLGAALAQSNDFSWNGPKPTTTKVPVLGSDCVTGPDSCGCCLMKTQMNRLEKIFNYSVAELTAQLQKSKTALVNLRTSRSAFSVALNNDQTFSCSGPFADTRPIVYRNVFLNLGSNYNVETGVFTAPRSGVYSFSLTIYSLAPSGTAQSSCANLLLNGKVMASLSEKTGKDREDGSTVVAAVQLQAGDRVAVSLPPGCDICDDVNHYNTFTGFLLYTTDSA